MLKNKVVLMFTALLAFSFSSSAMAVTNMKIQSVIGSSTSEVVMLKEFAANVATLTNG